MKKKKVTNEQIRNWLDNQITDMKTYDPRSEMEDGDHGLWGYHLRDVKEEQNEIVTEIKRRLFSKKK